MYVYRFTKESLQGNNENNNNNINNDIMDINNESMTHTSLLSEL